jgi:hypothetical protein
MRSSSNCVSGSAFRKFSMSFLLAIFMQIPACGDMIIVYRQFT